MTLAEYLKAEGMNASAFAKLLDVTPSTVTRWLTTDRKPDLNLMVKIETVTLGRVTMRDFVAPNLPSSWQRATEV